MSTQKLPIVPARGPLDATDQRHRDRDAHRRRTEVMRRQAGHLREIAHGRFGRVELPVGVGGKAGRGVPGQVGANIGNRLRIPRQMRLQPLDRVGQHQRHRGEAQHGEGILAPVHLLVGVHAAQLVDQPLDGAKDRVEPGALALENARHICAYRANRCQKNQGIKAKLQPAIGGHARTSPGKAV